MKKAVLFVTILLTTCTLKTIKEDSDSELTQLDYSLIEERIIKWKDIFNQEEETYLVYVFSESCYYCNQLKQDILSYYLLNKDEMYFIRANTDEGVIYQISGEDPVGVNDVDYLYIRGTPSLIGVKNKAVSLYLGGLEKIREYIFAE